MTRTLDNSGAGKAFETGDAAGEAAEAARAPGAGKSANRPDSVTGDAGSAGLSERPERLARKVIYENPWINVYVDRVRMPGGGIIEEHHVLDFEMQAVASVIEDDAGQVLLARVYRYPTGRAEWETPGGVIDEGESPLDAARREAFEETGYETSGHRRVYTFHPLNGISNKVFHVVGCRAGRKTGSPDPNEVRETRWFTQEDVRGMIERNELYDGFTLVGLLLWLGGLGADSG